MKGAHLPHHYQQRRHPTFQLQVTQLKQYEPKNWAALLVSDHLIHMIFASQNSLIVQNISTTVSNNKGSFSIECSQKQYEEKRGMISMQKREKEISEQTCSVVIKSTKQLKSMANRNFLFSQSNRLYNKEINS